MCGSNSADKIQNYCDAEDPYCCTGYDQQAHQNYGNKYGQQALNFVRQRLTSGGGGGGGGSPTSPPPTPSPTGNPGGNCAALWGQCGGAGWNGPTCCAEGTCRAANQWYSQCLL